MKAAILLIALFSSFQSQASTDAKEIDCIAKNAYFEARGEGTEGMTAVAQVTKNRVNSGKFPSTYCKVVYAKAQFSWTENKKARPDKTDESWKYAKQIATFIYYFDLPIDPTDGATYFHKRSIKPYWAKHYEKTRRIQNHVFYKPKTTAKA